MVLWCKLWRRADTYWLTSSEDLIPRLSNCSRWNASIKLTLESYKTRINKTAHRNLKGTAVQQFSAAHYDVRRLSVMEAVNW